LRGRFQSIASLSRCSRALALTETGPPGCKPGTLSAELRALQYALCTCLKDLSDSPTGVLESRIDASPLGLALDGRLTSYCPIEIGRSLERR